MSNEHTPLPRIIGTETEQGLLLEGLERSMLDVRLDKAMPSNVRMLRGGFLSNGGRLYVDHNDILEYATPECAGMRDAVHAEIAGDEIVMGCLQRLVERRRLQDFTINKRVLDDVGHSWGYHENYLINRDVFDGANIQLMHVAHMISRSIFSGAGYWKPTPENPANVAPSQKLQDLKTIANINTLSTKPLFNTRDEPHAHERWARLHSTAGDANISPWATWLKLGTTSLVLRLVENYLDDAEEVRMLNPVRAANEVAINPDATIDLDDGREVRAIDLQEMFIEQCLDMEEVMPLPKEELQILDEWQKAHDQYRQDPGKLIGKVDWISRQHILERYRDRLGETNLGRIQYIDRLWDNMDKQQGIGVKYMRKHGTFPGFNLSQAEYMTAWPPLNTRANIRGDIIRSVRRKEREHVEIDWETIELPTGSISLLDPYESQLEDI